MTDTNQLPEPELGYIKTDKSNQPAFSARQMREALKHAPQPAQATQAEVTDEFLYELWEQKYRSWIGGEQFEQIARAILALRPERAPMTEEPAEELAYQAFKDHMEDRNDDMGIDLVRKVERFHRIVITAQDKRETP